MSTYASWSGRGGNSGGVTSVVGGTDISVSTLLGVATVSYSGQWKDPVANMAALPALGNTSGDVRVTLDTGSMWEWAGSSWILPIEGATVWGTITGTISNQTDLQSALNAKQNTLTIGNFTDAGTDGIVVTGGTGSVIGSGTSIAQHVADSTNNGYLSSVDWSTFNGKQAAGNYITALTGAVTASGPGAAAATLTNASVTGQPITGFVTGAGTVGATDTILQAFNKLAGNGATYVVGPGSATDLAIARFDGTTGKLIKNTSTTTIDNSGNVFMGTSKLFFETPGTVSPAYGIYRTGGMVDIFVNNSSFTSSLRVESGGVLDINVAAAGGTLNIGGNNFASTALIQAGLGTSANGTILNIQGGSYLTGSGAFTGGNSTLAAGNNASNDAAAAPGALLVRGGNQTSATGSQAGGVAEVRGGNSSNTGNGGNVLFTPGTSTNGVPGAVVHGGRQAYTGIQRETSSTTVTIANNTSVVIADYGSLQATATYTLPASTALTNGQTISFGAGTNGVTALTLSAGSGTSITGALTTLVTGTSATYTYVTASTTWYRTS